MKLSGLRSFGRVPVVAKKRPRAPRVEQAEPPISMMDFLPGAKVETSPAEADKGLTVQGMKRVCEERVSKPHEKRPSPAPIPAAPPRWRLGSDGVLLDVHPPEPVIFTQSPLEWIPKLSWGLHPSEAGLWRKERLEKIFWND